MHWIPRIRTLEPDSVPGNDASVGHGFDDGFPADLDPHRPSVLAQVVSRDAGVETALQQIDAGQVDDQGGRATVRGGIGKREAWSALARIKE